jgi:uncharacterized protein (DUF697 family)/GTP-binding protein EngB required for normal cell division
VREGLQRAWKVTEQGLHDASGSVIQGLRELEKRRSRGSSKSREDDAEARAREAAADPAAFFDAAQEAAMKDLGVVNILISGQTGVGKSTLINAVLRVSLAEEGTGKPVTGRVKRHAMPGIPVTIFDTPGIELGQAKDDVIKDCKKTISDSRKGKPEDLIHVAWYCIDAGQTRLQDYDIEIIRALAEELEVILVLTQCIDEERAGALEEAIAAEGLPVHGEPIRTLARARKVGGATLPSLGLEELVDRTVALLPEAVKRAFINAQGVAISLKVKEARKVVGASLTAAAAVGAVPVPVPDAVVLLPIQLGMLARISAVFGIEMSGDRMGTLIKGLVAGGGVTAVGKQMAETLLKFAPVGAPINAAVAAAITGSLGEAYIQLCSEMLRRQAAGKPMPDVEMLPFLMDAYKNVYRSKNPLPKRPKARPRTATPRKPQ